MMIIPDINPTMFKDLQQKIQTGTITTIIHAPLLKIEEIIEDVPPLDSPRTINKVWAYLTTLNHQEPRNQCQLENI